MHSPILLLGLASLLGVSSHLCYFIHGEHHAAAPRIAQFYTVAFVGLYVIFRALAPAATNAATSSTDSSKTTTTPLAAAVCVAGAYGVSLWASMLVYRLFFHRVKGIPGPLLARITKLYHVYYALDTKQYLWLDGLNRRYGDFVRTGEFLLLFSFLILFWVVEDVCVCVCIDV